MLDKLHSQLELLHIMPKEARDVLDQIEQFEEQRYCSNLEPSSKSTDNYQLSDWQSNALVDTNAVNWALLISKLEALSALRQSSHNFLSGFLFEKLTFLLQDVSISSSDIPQSVLSITSFLTHYNQFYPDLHLLKTFALRDTYSHNKVIDALVHAMQCWSIVDLLPKALWKDIIQNKLVNFDKILDALNLGFRQEDELKDIGGNYQLVRKDYFSVKKSILTEID